MLKKMFLAGLLMLTLAGCSSHPTTMQDVSSYCRSLSSVQFCNDQDGICAKYSEIMLAPYNSAKECRMSCEKVRMDMDQNLSEKDCQQIIMNVEERCNEFCNSNYAN